MILILSHVQKLAGEIGPRGTGTRGEEDAANYVAERLSILNLPMERQTFRAVASQNAFPVAIDLVALMAVAIYPLGEPVAVWVAAGLALSTAPLLWHTIRTSSNPLRVFLPQVTSQNVIVHVEPRTMCRERAVILAHLDTNRCRIAWQSSGIRYLEPLTFLTLAVLASLGILYVAGALQGSPIWVWWVSIIPAGYIVGTLVTLWKDDRTPYSCGAHDNAASVAVALEVAASLAAEPLNNTQVWLAFTGAEETDHAGLYALLRRHGSILRRAAFIGLEGVGSGEIVYLTRGGLCARYRPDRDLLSLAEHVADDRPDLGVRGAQMTIEDEVGTLRRRGFRAIGIAGRDPTTGTLPHWHRLDDTVDTISAQHLQRTKGFVMTLLKQLDARASVAGE